MKRAKYISNGTITYKIIGDQGPKGPQGPKGDDGKSAYQIAVDNGYVGTEEEFNNKLVNIGEVDDKSITEEEFNDKLNSLWEPMFQEIKLRAKFAGYSIE